MRTFSTVSIAPSRPTAEPMVRIVASSRRLSSVLMVMVLKMMASPRATPNANITPTNTKNNSLSSLT